MATITVRANAAGFKAISQPSRASRLVARAGRPKTGRSLSDTGYVGTDNSGKGNVFPTVTQSFYSSPTSQAAASEGLGGAQGGIVLAGVIGLVGLATVAVLGSGSGDTLSKVQDGTAVQSLSAIAQQIAATL